MKKQNIGIIIDWKVLYTRNLVFNIMIRCIKFNGNSMGLTYLPVA